MNLRALIDKDYNCKAKYEYYLSLGYSEEASEVLSTVTYGNHPLDQIIREMGSPDILNGLRDWLAGRKEKTPQEAFSNYQEAMDNRKAELLGARKTLKKKGGMFPFGSNGPFAGAGRGLSKMVSSPILSAPSPTVDVEDGCEADYDDGMVGQVFADMAMPQAFSAPSMSADSAAFGGGFAMRMPQIAEDLEEAFATDHYETIEEKGAQDPRNAPTSTFRMTTNTASVGIILNQLREERAIDMSQVRLEELLNYFRYRESAPTDRKFKISTEQQKKGTDKELLYIHVGAGEETKDSQNIVLLLDVSGSMSTQSEVTQLAIATVLSKLGTGDRVSLITYSSFDETVLEGYRIKDGRDKELLMGKILAITIDGYTNGSAGIETAYQIGADCYDKDSNNQVILITDGDLNFGITKKDGLIGLIEEKKKTNLFLSVIGTGLYNYQDDKLEALSKHGNGTYCVVNNLEDVKESVNRRYISLTNIIAKDVKAQVEFNPRFVKSYRLLGYENRALSHADFKDDKVISEPYGSGGYGVALYELTMGDAGSGDLKYQKAELTDLDEICTVKVRYKEPLSDTGEEIEQVVRPEETASDNLKLAWFIYCIGEKLRDSDKLDRADEAFFQKVLRDKSYREFAPDNQAELALLISAVRK